MLRERLQSALKSASESGDECAAATLRLVLAAVKERDLARRGRANGEGVGDDEILAMLRDMVEQRRLEIDRCETCAQLDLADREAREMHLLETFLPVRMSERQIDDAVDRTVRDLGATRLKDTGRVIAALKERYSGQMDFARAKRLLCQRLH